MKRATMGRPSTRMTAPQALANAALYQRRLDNPTFEMSPDYLDWCRRRVECWMARAQSIQNSSDIDD